MEFTCLCVVRSTIAPHNQAVQFYLLHPYNIFCCCCQNWLSLFGLTVKTTSQWTFKVTQVESSASTSVFHPHSSMWRAPPVRGHKALKQCLLLGSAYITVKALPSGSASRSWRRKEEEKESVSGCLYVDLNYDQCFTVELPAVKSPGKGLS